MTTDRSASGASAERVGRVDQLDREELARGVAHREFELFLQPVRCTDDGTTRGHETLLRWRHPTLGLLAPASFLHLVEPAGLVEALGAWVVDEGARMSSRLAPVTAYPQVGINLFCDQLVTPALRDLIAASTERHGIPFHHLSIELTEEMVTNDVRRAKPVFDELRERGTLVAIDDFGTGYSNLARLNELHVDVIKVDRSIIETIDESSQSQQLIRAVLALAEAFDTTALAEGIETPRQEEILTELGCRYIQGFHIGEPASIDETIARLRAAGSR